MKKTRDAVERAEELRKYIKSKSMSRSGLERILSVVMSHIEGIANDEEKSYDLIYTIATNPLVMIDAFNDVCEKNGEVEPHDFH